MRQLTYLKKDLLRWSEVPEPQLQSADDAIVRPVAAGRCDGDNVFLHHNLSGPMRLGLALHYLDPVMPDLLGPTPFKGPIPVGHECVAEVVSCGEGVTAVSPGETV